MKLRSVLAAAAVLAAGALIPSAAPTQAHIGGSFCDGTLLNEVDTSGHSHTTPPAGHANGTGHNGAECRVPVQGFPVGAIARHDAKQTNAPAEVHIELFATSPTGASMKLGECSAGNAQTPDADGLAECTFEREGTPALTLPEEIPPAAYTLKCVVHTHAYVKLPAPQPPGEVKYGCYTTNEGENALRQKLGFPPAANNGGGPALPPPDYPEEYPGVPTFAAVAPDQYAPPTVVVSKSAVRTTGAAFVNADVIAPHDVIALNDRHPDGSAPWCGEYIAGSCPLFWSALIPGGQATPVLGLADVEIGSYQFTCSIHAHMVGTLEVVA